MIIKYEDVIEAINNYWNESEKLEKIINTLSFDDLKTKNINKETVKSNIKSLLFSKLDLIRYYEKLSSEDIYNMIINNELDFTHDKFFYFIIHLIKIKFSKNASLCLCKYIKEIRKIQVFNLYFEKDYNTFNLNYKNDNINYIKKYNINDNLIHIYDNNILNKILKEYDSGIKYRNLIKKYHPDSGFINEEYIKIINSLKKEKIIF